MSEQKEPQETTEADATVAIKATNKGLDVTVIAPDQPGHPAVHFAQWLGRNMQPLLMMAEQDYQRQEAAKPPERPALQLVSPNGGMVQ